MKKVKRSQQQRNRDPHRDLQTFIDQSKLLLNHTMIPCVISAVIFVDISNDESNEDQHGVIQQDNFLDESKALLSMSSGDEDLFFDEEELRNEDVLGHSEALSFFASSAEEKWNLFHHYPDIVTTFVTFSADDAVNDDLFTSIEVIDFFSTSRGLLREHHLTGFMGELKIGELE